MSVLKLLDSKVRQEIKTILHLVPSTVIGFYVPKANGGLGLPRFEHIIKLGTLKSATNIKNSIDPAASSLSELRSQDHGVNDFSKNKTGNVWLEKYNLLKPSRSIDVLRLRTNTLGTWTVLAQADKKVDVACRKGQAQPETLGHILVVPIHQRRMYKVDDGEVLPVVLDSRGAITPNTKKNLKMMGITDSEMKTIVMNVLISSIQMLTYF
ncbi:uncharacterized protein LOC122570293 [Bombus pyrosoma]|uniref:uncharacterized protein LOC122570293 n=1 Tax=Bombus pyrosoma TaxID=396416 RepID=UPI001CB9D1D6|nr:uncharacterized protein LOC122570293 [Bombus pyrosoma]